MVSAIVPTLTALGISLKGTMEQKQSSRVGRYAARKELLENPELLEDTEKMVIEDQTEEIEEESL